MRLIITSISPLRLHGRAFRHLRCCLVLGLAMISGSSALLAENGSDPIVRFHTDLGDMDVALLQYVAPNTVTNFLNYVNRGAYDGSFIHRSEPAFVIQGGGFDLVSGQIVNIPQDPPVVNEFHVSNTRGTLAMAKLPNDPNSATNQWFFNESDANAPNLDTQNGGFTVFGRIINNSGLTTMDMIAAVSIYNWVGTQFDHVPLLNYTSGAVHNSNLVNVIWIKVVPEVVGLVRSGANTLQVQGKGAANKTYNLQTSSSLAASTFTTLGSLTADSNGNISYNDNNPGTRKFYRLVIP